MGLLKKAHMKPFWIMCLALLMQASGTWLGMHMDQENPMNVFFGLFVYVGNTSGFALMLWFVYPAAGMLFAEIMKNVRILSTRRKKEPVRQPMVRKMK